MRLLLILSAIASLFTTDLNIYALDLAGEYRLRLLECAESERECREKVKKKNEYIVRQPQNLREVVPFFSGRAVLETTFTTGEIADAALLIGGIGTVDKTYINGHMIGSSGFTDHEGNVLPAWNRVRFYSIASDFLNKNNENRLRIEFQAFNVKSGIFRGPVKIDSYDNLVSEYFWLRFVYELIHYMTFGIIIISLFYLITIASLRDNKLAYYYLAATIGVYFLRSLYFIELPFSVDYLMFLKIQISGMATAFWSGGTYVVTNMTQKRDIKMELFHLIMALAAVSLIFSSACYNSYYRNVSIVFGFYVVFEIIAAVVMVIINRAFIKNIFFISMAGMTVTAFLHGVDFANHLFITNWPWLYHYLAPVLLISFLILNSYQLYNYKLRAAEYKIDIERSRVRIAKDLHDAVGADLTQLMTQAENLETHERDFFRHSARSAFENLKDIVFLLKNSDSEFISLKDFIIDHTAFMRSLKRYSLSLELEEVSITEMQVMNIQRIFTEWFSNMIRYSKPVNIRIILKQKKNHVYLLVLDDGSGFRWQGQANRSGLGNIAGRVKRTGGSVFARRRLLKNDKGTLFFMKMPVD